MTNISFLRVASLLAWLVLARPSGALSFSQLAGVAVEGPNHKKVGELKDIVLDLADGRVISVVISTADGHWLGIPPEAFGIRNDQRLLQLSTPRAQWPTQFSFPADKWPLLNQDTIRSTLASAAIRDPHRNFDVFVRGSELRGMLVTNFRNERLGEVKDVTFSLDTGRVDSLLLSTGSWAGANRRIMSVPPSLFMQHTDGKKLVLNADKNRLKHAILLHDNDLKNGPWGGDAPSKGPAAQE